MNPLLFFLFVSLIVLAMLVRPVRQAAGVFMTILGFIICLTGLGLALGAIMLLVGLGFLAAKVKGHSDQPSDHWV